MKIYWIKIVNSTKNKKLVDEFLGTLSYDETVSN